MQYTRKILNLLFVLIMTILIPFISSKIADSLNPLIIRVDPNGFFIHETVHHLLQMILVIILIKIYLKKDFYEIGFNLKNKALSLKFILGFTIIWIVIIGLYYLLGFRYTSNFIGYIVGMYPANLKNMLGQLSFDGFIVGFGEEPLFRSFVILALLRHWSNKIIIGKVSFSQATLISAFIFMIAHIKYTFNPFLLSADSTQLILNLSIGLFFGIVFENTKSLLAPIVMHNYEDTVSSIFGFVFSFIRK